MNPIIFWVLFVLLALTAIWKLLRRNHAYVEDHEYLQLLSFTEWKQTKKLQKEMQKLKGGSVEFIEVLHALRRLEEQGLTEHKDSVDDDGQIREFRRVSGGKRAPSQPTENVPDLVLQPA